MRLSRFLHERLLERVLNHVSLHALRKATHSAINDDAKRAGEKIFDDTLALYRELASSRGFDLNEVMDGSIKRNEGSFLAGLLIEHKPAAVLEVGTFVGFSTLLIAQALRFSGTGKVHSVDPWIPHKGISKPTELALAAAKKMGVLDQIEFTRGWLSSAPHQPSTLNDAKIPIMSQGSVLLPQLAPLDFVYIDGDHTVLNVVGDVSFALSFLKAGGVCVLHDVYSWPAVGRAITELLLDQPIKTSFRFEVLEGTDGLGIFRKIRETVAVGGVIRDRQSNNPIPGATIYTRASGGFSADTDSDGKIYVAGVPAGDYHIEVKADGYESIEDLFVHIDNGRRFQEVMVEMNRR